jgi:selenocysteine-specific elongation factor
MTAEKHFIVATAGHVDHGKSALVHALTGTDPDRLPEEKARGITIDLGFAHLALDGPDMQRCNVGIVDVPGHEDFVRNMVAGVGSIDLVLLVVAADDGWMPQTEEHLQILQYLGVARAVIALTKIDIGDADKIEPQIREQLRTTTFANAPIVRTHLGLSTAGLKKALATELAQIEPQRDIGKPRLFIDRTFTLRGVGTIVTGTLTGGTLRIGDAVVIQPRGTHSRIRSLQSHGREVDVAQPGTRTAINLPDLQPREDVARGDVVTTAGFETTTAVAAHVRRSSRLQQSSPIKSGASVYFYHGTSRVLARVSLLELNALAPGADGIARLELSKPALVFAGDRFIVRDGSEQHTIAGGVVLEVDMADFRSSRHVALLKSRAAAKQDDVDLYAKTELARRGATGRSQLLARSRFSPADVSAALERLAGRGEISLDTNIAADLNAWRSLRERAARLIDETHRQHPQRIGLEVSELRSALNDQAPDVIDALIADLCRSEWVRAGSTIARSTHRAMLPAALEAIAETIHQRLNNKPFDPPPRRQLVPDTPTQQALKFLVEQNEIVVISEDVVLSRSAYTAMKREIAEFITRKGPATVSQLRSALGSSRRVMVPLLELLDREGFTRRIGDKRALAPQSASAKLSDAPAAQPD